MKKMNYKLIRMAALLAAGAVLFACSKKNLEMIEEVPEVVEEVPEFVYSVSVNATKGDGVETRALTLDGSVLNAKWLTTESVAVKRGSAWVTGALAPQSEGANAVLKGSLTVTESPIVAGDELFLQFPKSGDPSYSGQKGTIADISANFDYATATVNVASVNDVTGILTTDPANFVNQQAIVEFVLTNRTTSAALDVETLTITAGGNDVTVTPDAATNDLYVALPGFAGGAFTLEATIGSNEFYYTNASFPYTIANSSFYQLPVKLRPVAINVSNPAGLTTTMANKNHLAGNTITYSIDSMAASPVVTATTVDDWITINATNATTVTYEVAQNKTKSNRTGHITLSYSGASNVVITVEQPS